MYKIFLTALITSSLIGLNALTFAQSNYTFTPQQVINGSSNLQGYAVYVPAGITVSAVLSSEINSQSAITGQQINAILMQDFIYNNTLIASAGSTLNGTIVLNKKAKFANRNAQIQVRFTTIQTPYNNIIPISGIIATNDSSGILKGASTKDSAKKYAKNTVIGAGSMAAIGTAMGALSGGSVGKGAVYGTAIGAGLGVMKSVFDKGEVIVIPANSQIEILFDQPITLGAQ